MNLANEGNEAGIEGMIFLTVCIAGLVIGIGIPAVSANTEQKTFTNSIGMEFVLIPAGEFEMGSPSNEASRLADESPVHRVKISNAFYMGKYEVTQEQWREVMGNNPSYFKGDNLPVEQLSWNDVQEFIKKLNEKEGTNKYRLPSEAEWEYGVRAGTTTGYSFGDDKSKLGEYAWYDGNSGSKTHEVGQKKPNPWGLYDMHGNVHELVQDIYHKNYNGAPADGGAWEGDGSDRVARGGSWGNSAGSSRSAGRRHDEDPGVSYVNLGFRLVSDSTLAMYTSQNAALQPKIVIDGNPQDWVGIKPTMTDPEGDSIKNVQGSDLKSLYALKDNNFLYLMLEVYDNPNATKERVQYVFEITENVDSPLLKWDYEIGSDAQGNTWLWNLTEYDTRANNENPNPYGLTRRVPGIEAVGKAVFEMKAPLSIIGDPENMIIRARTMLPDDRKFYDDMLGAKIITNPSLLISKTKTSTPTPLEPTTIPSKPETNWVMIGGLGALILLGIIAILMNKSKISFSLLRAKLWTKKEKYDKSIISDTPSITFPSEFKPKHIELKIRRTIYDPVIKDFISERKLHYPEVSKWLHVQKPPDYWFILRIDNLKNTVEQWAVELETQKAVSVKEAYVDGINCTPLLQKEESKAWKDGYWKNKYILSVPKERGIPLPSNGVRRLYFRLNIDCNIVLQPKYSISGKVIADAVTMPVIEKDFPFSCELKKLKELYAKKPEEVEKYVKERAVELYSLDAARAITYALKLYDEINKLAEGEYVEEGVLKNKIENLRTSLENVKKFTGVEKPLKLIDKSFAVMETASVDLAMKRWKDMNLFDVMMTELLKGRD